MTQPRRVALREVGPRDGLQVEAPVPVADRVRLIDALARTGLREIEAVSFVSPRVVPAMARADDVLAQLDRVDDVRYVALVPNLRGAELALAAGVDGLTVTASGSPKYNQRNVAMTIDQSVEAIGAICELAAGTPVAAVVSCAFGSPWEGDIAASSVAELGRRLADRGAESATYADTTGMATPRRVAELVEATGPAIGLHLHDTRGTALVNAYAALELGVAAFDTSVGGLGGSPLAPHAGGNLATEDLVHLLDDLEIETGVDLDRLLECSALAAGILGHPVPSRIASAGPRHRVVSA